ncbi:MAG: Histidyl-tRNA synthetase [Candidatus Ozemobacter sibiricus]|jgi:histidyl-tRNA synthetase|uniref:Histidine--tRNA ligase n=1 Tax=Candidatus Ozemobacter sibiricus TaxID=2268124 RepID=A0A367ZQ75_9BACT|nr:MAG: Histidyl-tRNA synthetase [Candidatus Ozemobacter sibiricus]
MNITTSPPSGTRDFLPADLARRRHLEGVIRRVYESFGFVPLETPAFEHLSTLLGKYGDEGDQLLFRLLHRRDKLARALQEPGVGEKDLADLGLRYDLTVPLARVIANTKDLPRFFKRYQIQPVWRADRPGKGRYREFWQCDIDITGTTSLLADVEVCSAVVRVFEELGVRDITIALNHRQLLRCLIQASGISPEQEETALVAIDKLDKIGLDGVRRELAARGIAAAAGERLLALISRPPEASAADRPAVSSSAGSAAPGVSPAEAAELDRLAGLLTAVPEAAGPLTQLRELLEIAAGSPAGPYLRLDATLARGLGYYTGPIFEIRSPAFSGSLGGGGRYDGLIGMFKGTAIPAVGFSIGFERLLLVMEERGLFGRLSCGPDVLFCRFPDASPADALRAANALRQAGLKVEVYPETPKIGKQFAYAESIQVKLAAILGAKEAQEGRLSIKHLGTGEQLTLPLREAAARLQEWAKTG